jgi:hypothetical protein
MAVTTEIAPNVYRISIFVPPANLQFNHFLVKDAEPLLYHTGLRGMHAEIREAVSKIIDLAELRHISFSHFESDECGSHNEWLLGAQLRRDLQPGGRARERERLHRPRGARPRRRPDFFHGKIPLPLLPDSPSAARLGRRPAFRGNGENAVLLRPVPPARRHGTANLRRCGGPLAEGDEGISN